MDIKKVPHGRSVNNSCLSRLQFRGCLFWHSPLITDLEREPLCLGDDNIGNDWPMQLKEADCAFCGKAHFQMRRPYGSASYMPR